MSAGAAPEKGPGPLSEKSSARPRLAIMGGTFDPIHNGHLALARDVVDQLGIEKVLFIPTGRPNFKRDQHVTDAETRADMVALAIEDEPHFVLDRREVERPGVTYTVDTLRELHAERPDTHFYFIIGADSAETLVHWRGAAEVARLATFVVIRRPGVDSAHVLAVHRESPIDFDLEFLDAPQVDVSSTEIRKRLSCGESVEGLIPPAVIAYIQRHNLYCEGSAGGAA